VSHVLSPGKSFQSVLNFLKPFTGYPYLSPDGDHPSYHPMPTVHLIITGRVQGVSYRFAAKEMAISLSLTGWIKNTAESHVEATVSGPEPDLQQFIDWCRQGPRLAAVSDVIIQRIPEISFDDFSIRGE
jgi:acylphosphatase